VSYGYLVRRGNYQTSELEMQTPRQAGLQILPTVSTVNPRCNTLIIPSREWIIHGLLHDVTWDIKSFQHQFKSGLPRLTYFKSFILHVPLRGYIQKFPDWPPGTRTANGTALCDYVQLYRYFVSQSSEFYRHNPLCCFSTSVFFGGVIYLSIQSGNFWIYPRIQ
jgi:hypothetical protein